ncbi:ATP-binding protein [Streptomyces rubellomurinus]|uniref:ATP-binding protein n=1 Tax=Streptomyces rubellomurinus (strain ATCC 31215) TaxID=359131 RepID=UPI000698561E|nr:SbcC/MukB-like Walker B domain-containing protein [Streptomyces rubellomurinus]
MSLISSELPLIPKQSGPSDDTLGIGPGFRLTRLEVLNWGTFHRSIWSFTIDGRSALLTGGVGSGKSTLVDAMTTLLLPAHKIAYNKAAGAEAKERDLRSYVLGHYKNERVEATNSTRPVGLRNASSYSVILGVFSNYVLDTHVTLAQVFWVPDANTGQPDRFYVTADTPMSIDADFTGFGTDIADLRRRLKQRKATVYGHYPQYGKALRRSLGIPSDQALDLFHQTVSMKAVGSLDEFVRDRMLEPFDARAAVDKIVAHFDALTASHAEVVRAREMIDGLGPIVDACDRCDGIQRDITMLQQRREVLPVFFAQHRRRLLDLLSQDLKSRITELADQQTGRESELERLRDSADTLRRRIDGAGGEKLVELDARIKELGRDRERRRDQASKYDGWLGQASLAPVTDAVSFRERSDQIAQVRARIEQQEQQAREELDALAVQRDKNNTATQDLRREITSLQSQRSSIPSRLLSLRQDLAAALEVVADELPFAGELIQVRDDEAAWAGAAERVLRGFALSLLVPEVHYEKASAWVNGRHLGLRLVYYKVPAHTPAQELPNDRDLLLGKLELKDDCWAHDWLAMQLRNRADYLCAADLDTFTRSSRPAVTRQGLVKGGGGRHEKNDASRIDDRSSWVLGWSNQAKLEALLAEAASLTKESAAITTRTAELKEQQKGRERISSAVTLLANISEYVELDWQACVTELEQAETQKKALVAEAGLDRLTAELKDTNASISHYDKLVRTGLEALGGLRRDSEDVASQLKQAEGSIERADVEAVAKHESALRLFLPSPVADVQVHLDLLKTAETEAPAKLSRDLDGRSDALRRAASQATSKMTAFRSTYPQYTNDLDASLESAAGYRALHSQLVSDDLPRFEAQFLLYLRTNVIRDIASFQANLLKQEQEISERIELINTSLAGIDYNPGRYVRLNAAPTTNVEIRDFRQSLRECTSDVLATETDDAYTEEKFLQVKRLLDRFKGRPEHTRMDADWTARVTDVRRWFTFSASEHSRADGAEHEVYSDSGGKSGGQKEKLAYTILAASLAYQFRIDPQAKKPKTFHFVVIDEAFGRGDDASAHFALDLFHRLGLQLLVVTPLQKLHVIEPHVTRVGYVDRPDKIRSRLTTLTIEEFRAHKSSRQPAPHSEAQQ